jgi:hypothetical protein
MGWFSEQVITPCRQWLYAPPQNAWLHQWLRWQAPVLPVDSPPNYLSLMALFKNEAPYLAEWLEYHRLVGVDHVFLYNNQSDDNYAEVLAPYLQAGFVTVIDWPYAYQQPESYRDCIQRFHAKTQWLAVIDCDEYLVPDLPHTSLHSVLKPLESYPMIAYFWRFFGTGGRLHPEPDRLVCEQFLHCMPSNAWFKTLYNMRFAATLRVQDSHTGKCRVGGLTVYPLLPNGHFALSTRNPQFHPVSYSPVQVNHYWSKSAAEYTQRKVARGRATTTRFRSEDELLAHDSKCSDTDTRIARFWLALKLRLTDRAGQTLPTPETTMPLTEVATPLEM